MSLPVHQPTSTSTGTSKYNARVTYSMLLDHALLFTFCYKMDEKLFMGIEISTQQVFADFYCTR